LTCLYSDTVYILLALYFYGQFFFAKTNYEYPSFFYFQGVYIPLPNVYFILIALPLGLKETDTQAKSIMKIENPKIKKKIYIFYIHSKGEDARAITEYTET